ncbi:MAG: hypothetical protein U5R31_01660 [Acidimicrobiia bacterium]|nr:hypothetical protein [Acidimicrobiia bacterium]
MPRSGRGAAERLRELIDLWWREAEAHQVLPLDNRPFSEFVLERPRYLPERHHYEYWPYRAPVPEEQAPDVRNRDHLVTARVVVVEGERPHGALGGPGIGARRLVVPPDRGRDAQLRAQPVGAGHLPRRHAGRAVTWHPRSRLPLHTGVAGTRGAARSTATSSGRARSSGSRGAASRSRAREPTVGWAPGIPPADRD